MCFMAVSRLVVSIAIVGGVCVRWICLDAVYDLIDTMLAMNIAFDIYFTCFACFYVFITIYGFYFYCK